MAQEHHGFTWMSVIPGLNELPDHTATAVALPRRAAEVIRDLPVASRVGVQRRRRIYEDPTRAVPAVDLDADAECAKHERTAHRRRQLFSAGRQIG